MKRTYTISFIPLAIICSTACSTTSTIENAGAGGPVDLEAPVVTVVPGEDCPEPEPDLTRVVGADLNDRGLYISVRTTTWCDNHEFTLHRCHVTERSTSYRVSETNDCEISNDGVMEHVLLIEREWLGSAARIETVGDEQVTVSK